MRLQSSSLNSVKTNAIMKVAALPSNTNS